MKIEFNSKPVYGDDDEYIKTKIKMYGGSVNTYFYNKKMSNQKAPSIVYQINVRFYYQSKRKNILKHFWKSANVNKKG